MEDINGLSSEFGTLHCGVSPGGPCNETTGIGSGQRACGGCQTGFHTYAIEYDRSVSPEQIRWYLDGNNFFTVNANQVDATTWNNATHHGFFMILNVAIGGGFPAAFGGGPTGSTAVRRADGGRLRGGVHLRWRQPRHRLRRRRAATRLINANGLCLDDRSSSTANGNPVQIYTCNGTGAQQWTYVEAGSTLHVLGKCLDITGGGTANGTKVQLWDCNNTGAQVFIHAVQQLATTTRSPTGAWTTRAASTTPGTQVQIWDCNGSGAQHWTFQ